jgi:D-arabinose 1-dehydrogenase-like Zn-dependent alcohol dehydrogenase
MCAGITLYDPLQYWGATKPGVKMCIGIIGIGGLGTMGIKMAKAMGHRVVAISTSANKAALAKEKGADAFVVSTDPASMTAETNKMDLILNTISANHQLAHYIPLLRTNGTLVQLGLTTELHSISQTSLLFQRKSIAGSNIGGIKTTEACLDFCAKHGITPDVEIIEADKIDWAWEQLLTINKDGIRYVIDVKKSLENKAFVPTD